MSQQIMSLRHNVVQSIYSYIFNAYTQLPPEQPSAPCQVGRRISIGLCNLLKNFLNSEKNYPYIAPSRVVLDKFHY